MRTKRWEEEEARYKIGLLQKWRRLRDTLGWEVAVSFDICATLFTIA